MRWYALDLETATKTRGSICEVGVVEFNGKKPTGNTFHSMIRPPGNIYDPEIQTHYDRHSTETAPEWADIAGRVGEVVGACPLVAHYAVFDVAHMEAQHKISGAWRPEGPVFCSLRLARWAEPSLRSHRLEALVKHHNLTPLGELHTALADAHASGQVFVRYTAGRKVGDVMREMAADSSSGTLPWLFKTRDTLNPEPATSRQADYISDLYGSIARPSDGAHRLLLKLGGGNNSAETFDAWVAQLTKNQASDVISYLLQLQPTPPAARKKAASELARQTHVEHELAASGNGLWYLTVAGCGPVILLKPPPPGAELRAFCSTAGEKTLDDLSRELSGRPTV